MLVPLNRTDNAPVTHACPHMFHEFVFFFSTGKLFHSKDLLDFVHFFLMFYKVKPIDMLLDDIFLVKKCNWGEHIVSVPLPW